MPLLIVATFLMGSSFPTGKILLVKIPPFTLAGWRFVTAAIATLPIAVWASASGRRRSSGRQTAQVVMATVCIGLTQTGGTMGFLNLALRTLPASTAAILLFSNPIWVALAGGPLLGEHLRPTRWIGLALGVVGVALTVGLSLRVDPAGALLGLGSSLCFATATILNKRFQPSVNSWMLTFWQMLIGGLALLAAATLYGQQWPRNLTGRDWAYFWWLAIPASTGSFGLWFLALQRAGANQASSFLFLAPVFAVVLSHVLLHEAFSPLKGLGALLVIVALCLLNYRRAEAPRARAGQVSR